MACTTVRALDAPPTTGAIIKSNSKYGQSNFNIGGKPLTRRPATSAELFQREPSHSGGLPLCAKMPDADRQKPVEALTPKLGHPTGALQLQRASMRHWRQTNASWNFLFNLWRNTLIVEEITFAADD